MSKRSGPFKQSADHRAKLAAAHLGKPLSEEHKELLRRIATKGQKSRAEARVDIFAGWDDRCQICGRETKYPQLDHNHKHCVSGCVECFRGILCPRCNGGLSMVEELLIEALEYLG